MIFDYYNTIQHYFDSNFIIFILDGVEKPTILRPTREENQRPGEKNQKPLNFIHACNESVRLKPIGGNECSDVRISPVYNGVFQKSRGLEMGKGKAGGKNEGHDGPTDRRTDKAS